VLKACDACADIGQLLRSVHFYEGLYSSCFLLTRSLNVDFTGV